jgi:hypothetical protein
MYYKKFREIQEKYGIDDEKLCDICTTNYNVVKPLFDKWWKETHPE